jgi:hypothetical protein
MVAESRMRKSLRQTAVAAVARHYSANWEAGDGSADAWLTLAGKRIAVHVATIRKNIGSETVTKPRLRFDRVALGLVARLQSALRDSAPEGRTVIVTVTAPIRQDTKTTAALEQIISTALAGRPPRADIRELIHGNHIRVRVVKTGSTQAPKLVGFVHNPDPGADIMLLDSAEALLKCMMAETDRRAATEHSGDSWLVIATEGTFPPIATWRQICLQLPVPTGFGSVLMVSAEGRVEELDKPVRVR